VAVWHLGLSELGHIRLYLTNGSGQQMASAKKKKLLVVLGAGSSVPCGIPGTAEIDAKMSEWSKGWAVPLTHPKGSGGDGVFNDLWKFAEKYAARNLNRQLGLRINFEYILGEMTSLASWVSPSPFGNLLSEVVRDSSLRDGFTWPGVETGPYFRRQIIIPQLAYLLDQLARFMRARSAGFDESSSSFATYRSLFAALRSEFEVGIYSLNYDNLALRAWPDAFTGFNGENFNARQVGARANWEFIYHLHGSVHYSVGGLPMQPAIEWKNDLAGEFVNSKELEVNMASKFVPIVPSALIAGGYKLDQILADPAQTFYSSLVRHVHQAEAVLLIGYSFGDAHINRALLNRFALSPYDPTGRPPAVVVTKTGLPGEIIGVRQSHELMAWEMVHAINTRFPFVGAQPPAPSLETLLNEGRFEIDANLRAAVWHNGFLKLADKLPELIARLKI
jgi:hypothetical protein